MRTASSIALVMVAGLLGGALWADPGTPAEDAIPFGSLTETNRALVKGVTDHYTLRRPYASQTLTVTLPQLEWMLDNLHPTWSLARELGLKVRATKPDEQGRLWNVDGDGSKGYITPVYRAPGKRVYYMEGSQKKVWTVHGRGVVVINYEAAQPGKVKVSGAQFVRVDNAMMAAITQLCGPLLCGMVDKVYLEFIEPLGRLGALAANDPTQLRGAMQRLPKPAAEGLQGLAELLPVAAAAANSPQPDRL